MQTSFLVLLLFGCLTGVTAVFFGLGGGFVTVPAVYAHLSLAGESDAMHLAVATSTAVTLVNATAATVAHHRERRLRREYLWPMAVFIAVGSVVGSAVATRLDGTLLRLFFVAYLMVAVLDALLRKGFLAVRGASEPQPPGRWTAGLGGTGIGAVAAALGVGGSVLTVPLLRRRGLAMVQATAMANPLAVPVAASATLVYALAGPASEHAWRIGHVDLALGAAVLAGALPTIAALRRLPSRIPDRVHSVGYVVLLALILAGMAVAGF